MEKIQQRRIERRAAQQLIREQHEQEYDTSVPTWEFSAMIRCSGDDWFAGVTVEYKVVSFTFCTHYSLTTSVSQYRIYHINPRLTSSHQCKSGYCALIFFTTCIFFLIWSRKIILDPSVGCFVVDHPPASLFNWSLQEISLWICPLCDIDFPV